MCAAVQKHEQELAVPPGQSFTLLTLCLDNLCSFVLRCLIYRIFPLHHSSVVSQEEDSHRDLIRKKLGREWVSQDSCVVGRLRIEGDSVNSNL